MNTPLPPPLNETLELLNIELPCELSDFIESGHDDLSNHLHEIANNCFNVLNNDRAEDFYNSAEISERDEASKLVNDCRDCSSRAERFCLLAYWITYNRLEKTIQEQADAVVDRLETAIEHAEDKLSNVFCGIRADDLRGLKSTFENL